MPSQVHAAIVESTVTVLTLQ